MQPFKSSSRTIFTFLLVLAGLTSKSEAQNTARIEKVQRTVEKQADGTPLWAESKPGTTLVNGDRVRTGKRSKSDIRFSDKSLLRLGQLSSLEMRGTREMRLLKGQLLFSALSPARILAGSAAAAIKGTVPLIQVFPNGDAEISLYSGLIELTSPQGTRTLQPGQWIRVYADGRFSPVKAAAPFLFQNGARPLDLLLPPRNEPFAGGDLDVLGRENPTREIFNTAVSATSRDANTSSYNPFINRSSGSPSPTRTPVSPTPTPVPTTVPTTGPTPPGGIDVGGITTGDLTTNTLTRRLALAAPDDNPTSTAPTTTAATGEEHLGDVDTYLGSSTEFDGRLLGATAFGNGDGNVLGGRLGVTNTQGRVYFDLAVTPLRLRDNGRTRETALVTQALMLYRTEKYDFQFGRQHILDGPVQATLYGSMLRQGGRNTVDAVRFTAPYNNSLRFDLAYLVDAYPRQLASDVPGRQKGFYGRVETRNDRFALALNLLKFSNAPVADTTGATVDFTVPLVANAVEVYGEVGRDPFKRKTQTFGMDFPILYEKAGIDLFLETAKLRSSSSALAPNREYAARVYKQLGPHWNLLAGYNKFQGGQSRFILGVTVGGSRVERNDVFNVLSQLNQ